MKILDPSMVTVTFDYGEVNSLSVSVLEGLIEENTTVQTGSLALALALGRLLSPTKLDEESEVKFLESLLSYIGTYFGDGGKLDN